MTKNRFEYEIEAATLTRRGNRTGWAIEGVARAARKAFWIFEVACRLGGDSDGEPLRIVDLQVVREAPVDPAAPASRVRFRAFVPVDDRFGVARRALLIVDVRLRSLDVEGATT